MMLKVLIFTLLVDRARQVPPGPKFPPTKGEVWPNPQNEKKEQTLYKFQKAKFEFQILKNTCKTLTDAVDRMRKELYNMDNTTKDISRRYRRYLRPKSKYNVTVLHKLEIEMSGPCEEYPYLGMDESYNLRVSTVSKLTSPSLWGMLRGLETFLQLFYVSDDYGSLLVNGTSIYDYPRYPHRGLLLDTARHYLTTSTIKAALDAMAMNKLNVFHWHIVDDQSFPYQSDKYPEISEKGAYHPTMVYTKSDIQDIVNYARDRGIRVIPEMDVPGHTRSWGIAHPEILVECFIDKAEVVLGPLNPASDFTYKFVGELLQEVQQRFPEEYLHLGGDEIDTTCWAKCPYLGAFLAVKNITLPQQLINEFFSRLIPLLGNRTQPIVWQDVFDEGAALPNGTLIQIWRYDGWIKTMNSVLSHKMRVIFSSEWYLDQKDTDWEKIYTTDPRSFVTDVRHLNDLVGGEACMWGEQVDNTNILSRLWPKASAVAERLWSHAILDDAIKRLSKHPSKQPDRPRITPGPVSKSRYPLISNAVVDFDHLIFEAENKEPMSEKNTFQSVSRISSTFKPAPQTSSTFKPAPLTRRAFDPVVFKTSSTFKPASQTTSTSKPVSQTRKLTTTHMVDLNLFEKANLIMEEMLLRNDLKSVKSRLEEHACRMIRRGVPVQPPNGAGFCVV